MAPKDFAQAIIDIIGANDKPATVDAWLDTGFAPLNHGSSADWNNGFPVGRLIEIAGPPSAGKTAIATRAMIAAQKQGGIAIFMDHERSFSFKLAEKLGLDTTPGRFIYRKPTTFEESVALYGFIIKTVREKKLIPKTAPMCCVFDSLAAMVPQSILTDSKGKDRSAEDRNMNDNTALARATSAHFPAISMLAEEHGVCGIFLNQLRTKIGVCHRYDTPVILADGSSEYIGKIVNAGLPVDVLTVNEKTGAVESKTVTQFHKNPMDQDGYWINVKTSGGRNGMRSALSTPEHPYFTQRGEVHANDLVAGDQIVTLDMRYFTDEQHEVVLGSILGDGSLRFEKNGPRGHLRLGQGFDQTEYLRWKAGLLDASVHNSARQASADTRRSLEFGIYKSIEKAKGLIHIPQQWVDKLTPRAVAIWFLDDGHHRQTKRWGHGAYSICAKLLPEDDLRRVAEKLESLGMGRATVTVGKGLFWFGEEGEKFGLALAPFTPECMSYKINHQIKERCVTPIAKMDPRRETYLAEVLSVDRVPVKKSQKSERYKYDIGVEDNHNYFVNGLLVHNCYGDPRKTTGGESPAFYFSQRIWLGASQIKVGTEVVGVEVTGKFMKNKVARPFKEAKWRFMFEPDGTGRFDVERSLIDFLEAEGCLTKGRPGFIKWEGVEKSREALAQMIRAGGDVELAKLKALLPKVYEPPVVAEVDPIMDEEDAS